MSSKTKLFFNLFAIAALSIAIAFAYKEGLAWTSPTINPPGGSGVLKAVSGDIGIGVATPSQKLDVSGYVKGTGFCIGSDCITTWPSSGVSGSGSTGYIARWTSSSALGSSVIYDNGTRISVGTASPDASYRITTSGGGVKAENSSSSQPAGYFSNAGGAPAITAATGGITLGGVNRTSWPTGTVTSVATNNGLTGGTITTSGTIGLNTTSLSTGTAATGKVYWDGTKLVSGTDQAGGGLSGGTANYVTKWTGASAIASSQIFDNATNVGIGTTAPGAKLDVAGDILVNGIKIGKGGGGISTNTAVGFSALYSNTSGWGAVANGYNALYSNTTGSNNTANGYKALQNNTTGNYNTANGYGALQNNTTGWNNTANGLLALQTNTTGTGNTAIGYNANVSSNNLTNATAIGYTASANASNKVRIGNPSVTSIEGQVGWSSVSDGRTKYDIHDSDLGLGFIIKLRPVSYKRINGDGGINYGFIAQEVESAIGKQTNIVMTDNSPEKMKTMRHDDLIAPLVKSVQEQQQQIENQNKQILELKSQIKKLVEG